jgi:hypothetical protein
MDTSQVKEAMAAIAGSRKYENRNSLFLLFMLGVCA